MYWYRIKRKPKRRSTVTKHYLEHKELARGLILNRLEHWNGHYNFSYNRVAIRNQRRCWGSCTDKGNLNFNYKLIFLPEHLMDYVVVHELCHLAELNHGQAFWNLVEKVLPDYKDRIGHLREIEKMTWGNYMKTSLFLERNRTAIFNSPESKRSEGAVR